MAEPIPYGRQTIGDEDIAAVTQVLRSTWLTTGPVVPQFEAEFAAFCGAQQGVAVNSGTAALHVAMHALGVAEGDEVIVPALTFAATSNAALYCGARPVFADVDPDTLLVDPAAVERAITPRTKVIAAVDYAGQPADYDALGELARRHGLKLLADACHAPGATLRGRPVGTLADASAFSFHPVKHLTTGEGGLVTTNDPELARRMRRFRNHGIDTDHRIRAERGTHAYDMVELGFNYRLNDIQSALGRSQLRRLPAWLERRRAVSGLYDAAFAGIEHVVPLRALPDRTHAYHLYVVRVAGGEAARDEMFHRLRQLSIGANVHYRPVYLHSYYRDTLGHRPGECPTAEAVYGSLLTLPIYPTMSDADVERVLEAVRN